MIFHGKNVHFRLSFLKFEHDGGGLLGLYTTGYKERWESWEDESKKFLHRGEVFGIEEMRFCYFGTKV